MADFGPQDANSSQSGHLYRGVIIDHNARAHLGDMFISMLILEGTALAKR